MPNSPQDSQWARAPGALSVEHPPLAPFHHLPGLHKRGEAGLCHRLAAEEKRSHRSLETRRAECPELNGRKSCHISL